MLSIKAGRVSSAVLLRKLGNYSRTNRLYEGSSKLLAGGRLMVVPARLSRQIRPV